MEHKIRRISGFTLTEIMVVMVIIVILATIGLVQYNKMMEENRADQAISLVREIAAASHMYSLDNTGGSPPAVPAACVNMKQSNYPSGQITDACNSQSCVGNQNDQTPCDLVACGYLPPRDWDSLPWSVYAVNPADTPSSSSLCGPNFSGVTQSCNLACDSRNGGSSPYNSWGYIYNYTNDTVTSINGAPSP